MSTFVVSLGVIVVAVSIVTWLALRDVDQRATTRRATVREPAAARPGNPAPVGPPKPAAPRAERLPGVVRGPRAARRPPNPGREVAVVYVPGGRARAGLSL
ncbi:MAG TPA: hypothetical protein VF711_06615, partial [Acidimicrobiales bacterium]